MGDFDSVLTVSDSSLVGCANIHHSSSADSPFYWVPIISLLFTLECYREVLSLSMQIEVAIVPSSMER